MVKICEMIVLFHYAEQDKAGSTLRRPAVKRHSTDPRNSYHCLPLVSLIVQAMYFIPRQNMSIICFKHDFFFTKKYIPSKIFV